ncbi:MAG: YheT family hydrolase [Gemmatimonadales bacterium]
MKRTDGRSDGPTGGGTARPSAGPAARPFHPAWWLPGAHLQTVMGRFVRRKRGIRYHRERLETPDGDFLDLEYGAAAGEPELPPEAPLVLKLHGLEGSAHSGYTAELTRVLHRRGIRSVGLNFRSCGGEMNRTARFYHSGETEDLALVLAHLRNAFPASPLGLVGFSLGGNVMLKYLGEAGEAAREAILAAVAISVPYDLRLGVERMRRPPGLLYARFFIRQLQRKVLAKQALLQDRIDVARALRARTFDEFDDAVTAPLHGFAGAEDYYGRSSSAQFLPAIRVPTLLIHAADDPMAPAAGLPEAALTGNRALRAAVTPRGGHVGFIEGVLPWRPRFWAEETAGDWLGQALGTRR